MRCIKSYKRKEHTKHEKTSLQAVQIKSCDELRFTSSLNRWSVHAERIDWCSWKCESERVSAGISFHTTDGRIVAFRASPGRIYNEGVVEAVPMEKSEDTPRLHFHSGLVITTDDYVVIM